MTVRVLAAGALLLASLGPGLVAFQAADSSLWTANAASGELVFSAWYEGEEIEGRFRRFEARVKTDGPGHAPVTLEVDVDTGSVDMNDREVNAELAEPEWFGVANFPAASFRSAVIRASGDGYVAVGALRIKDIERALELPLEWNPDGAAALLSGSVRLSRRDWQIGTGEWSSDAALADGVEVRYRVELTAPH